jgi:hypothetical protein
MIKPLSSNQNILFNNYLLEYKSSPTAVNPENFKLIH